MATPVPEPPGETLTGAAYAGGTRLRAVLAEASDGTASFFHFWDTELAVSCQFEPVDEPETSFRCRPASAPVIYEGAGEFFADAKCTQPLLPGPALSPDGPRIVKRMDTQCWIVRDYFRVGAPFTATTVYRKTETDCVPEASAAQNPQGFLGLERLSPSAFVAASVADLPAAGPVARTQLEAEDGARAIVEDASSAPCASFGRQAGSRCSLTGAGSPHDGPR